MIISIPAEQHQPAQHLAVPCAGCGQPYPRTELVPREGGELCEPCRAARWAAAHPTGAQPS
jgi:hypothetical protein